MVSLLLFSSCSRDTLTPSSEKESKFRKLVTTTSPDGSLEYWILPQADDFSKIPQEPKNPLNPSKVELGKLLFHETAFATEALNTESIGTYSCATCHIASAGFRPGAKQGIADGGLGYGINGEARERNTSYEENEMDVQGTRPLSMLNAAFVENTSWNGSFGSTGVNVGTEDKWVGLFHNNILGLQGLEAQNIEGIKLHRMKYDSTSVREHGYQSLFDDAFPDFPKVNRYTDTTASYALSAYLRTLMSDQAPFQDWLKGDEDAMSYEEKEGGMLFFGKGGCTNCHNGPSFSAVAFHAIGVNDMYQQASFGTTKDDMRNFGRGGFTDVEEDMYKFKVPQLYNMSDTKFYFHGSSYTDLEGVVRYFNDAVPENENVPTEQISEYFRPLNLTEEEIKKLTLFLEKSLRDPNLDRYVPDNTLSGKCSPNADLQSQMDIGCF